MLSDKALVIENIERRGDVREYIGPREKVGEKLVNETAKKPDAIPNNSVRAQINDTTGDVTLTFGSVTKLDLSKSQ